METPTATTIDRFPVKDLESRYSIQRTQAYDRRKFLNIETWKDGRTFYISGADLEELDRLDRHIASGGTFTTFTKRSANTNEQIEPASLTHPAGHDFGEPPLWMLRLLDLFSRSLPPESSPTSVLDSHRELEEACQNGWLLSTSQVCKLLGIHSIAGTEFDRMGFRFIRSGKVGRQAAWAIKKAPTDG